MKGKINKDPMEKRKKARVKGGIFCRDHLKIGEAAPQIMLAIIRATIAFFLVDMGSYYGNKKLEVGN